MSRYNIHYERDDQGWWTAQVAEVPAAITQGRSIAEARRRIREALAAALDDDRSASAAELRDRVSLPSQARRVLARAVAARRRLEAEVAESQVWTQRAVQTLTADLGLSVRDASELLGISHQRVQQLQRGSSVAAEEGPPWGTRGGGRGRRRKSA